MKHSWDDAEARLRRDADTIRRAAQPAPTLHHHIMTRLATASQAPISQRAFRFPAQVLVAVVLVVAVVAVFFGTHYLAPAPAGHRPTQRTPTATPSVQVPPAGLVGPNGYPVPQGALLKPGTYEYRAVDGTLFNVRFTVPAGWTWNGRYLSKGGSGLPDGAAIFFDGRLVQVYTDPCHWSGANPSPPTGSSVQDLIAALAAQPMRSATTPINRNANVSGVPGRWPGIEIRLSVPNNIALAGCDHGQFRSWGPDQDARAHQGPGQRDLVWAVDLTGNGIAVGGERLIIDAASFPDTPSGVMSEIDAILASIVTGHWG